MMKSWPITVLFFLLTSCAAPPSLEKRQMLAQQGPGRTLTLNRELHVESEKSRVYIQNGQVISADDLQLYQPYCYFFLYRSMNDLQGERTIKAGTFTVLSVRERREHASASARQIQLARLWDMSFTDLMTHIDILDERQVDVTGLVCGRFASPSYRNFLTPVEIRQNLSPLVRFN